MTITIVGLGPGDGRHLTREAWSVLSSAEVIYLRTERHPVLADLPQEVKLVSFDHLYATADDFEQIYERITANILELGREAGPNLAEVVYAVPGHPLVGETSVMAIIRAAEDEGMPVRIIPGLSFIEPTLIALGVDALDGLQLFDAIEIAGYNHPPPSTDVPLLIGQLFDKLLANDLKLALMALYPDEHGVILVHAAGTASQFIEEVPLYGIDRSDRLAHLTSLFVPALPQASGLPALAETVAYLRGPSGCPWDQEQSRQSLRAGLLEETSEALAAIDSDDGEALCEELGDILYHIVMQAQIASEGGEFKLSDVVAGIESKLRRRHPHVWGDWNVDDSAEVIRNWEILKASEKSGSTTKPSLLDNIPNSLPALARAQEMQERVRRIGFDWPSIDGVMTKLAEEIREVQAAASQAEGAAELGDVLFATVNLARWLDVDAEIALREANLRFDRRFRKMETMASERDQELGQLQLEALDELWEEAKAETVSPSDDIAPSERYEEGG